MILANRQAPHNITAEQGVIGSILYENHLCAEVAAFLDPEDFFRDAHQKIYRIILEIGETGKSIDWVVIGEILQKREQYEDIGGESGIREIMESTPNAADGMMYAQIVKELSVLRKLAEQATKILDNVYARQMESADVIDDAERRIFSIGEGAIRRESTPIKIALQRSVFQLQQRKRGIKPGVKTGFIDLDGMTDGLHPQKLYILAARPSMGKSALALNAADHVALEEKQPVLFMSLEMSEEELADRMIMSRAGVDGGLMRVPKRMPDEDMGLINEAVDYLSEHSKLVIEDPPHITITQLVAKARRHKARHGLGLFVVDYLQLIDGQRNRGDNREQEIAGISRRLKGMAKELNIPVLALCQLSRASENREDRRPRLADLRESGQIEQDADVVILIHRPEYYDPNEEPGVAHVIIAKNRGGPTGQIKLGYVKGQTRFQNLANIPDNGRYHERRANDF